MELIYEPRVYVLASPMLHGIEVQKFLAAQRINPEVQPLATDALTAGDKVVEISGRVCYMSFAKRRPGGNVEYIENILQQGHGSVIEHAVYSLLISGVSRNLTHELIRHRAGMSYSELSQRFVDIDSCGVVVPHALRSHVQIAHAYRHKITTVTNSIGEHWLDIQHQARGAHRRLVGDLEQNPHLSRKQVRQAARSALPGATETVITVTGNARAFRHFLELRGSEHADTEIRILAGAVLEKLRTLSNVLFSDYTRRELDDGTYAIESKYRKV